jgi:hypothetical protein
MIPNKHTGQDGPEGNQVKQKHGGNPRPHESHNSSDDSDNAPQPRGANGGLVLS